MPILGIKTRQFFYYYMLLNKFLQIKRWSLIENIETPCLHIHKGRPLD
jgi:hypothetical protein